MGTAFVFHELYLWHDTGNSALLLRPGLQVQPGEHAENPETKRRFKNLLDVSGLSDHLDMVRPRPATVDEIRRFHTAGYVDRVRALSDANGGNAGDDVFFGPGSFEIAQLAAGGAIVAMDAVLSGGARNAYALIRPPGHHALADMGMGYCIFGNAVIAIHHARALHGLGRVAVVDWDVHHGNGTEAAFYEDGETLTISLHQDNLYPAGSGAVDDNGAGAGLGANINIPLPPGSGHGAYLAAMERVVIPALDRFRPDVIVVACGYDASACDPLGRMMLHSDSFRQMTAQIMAAADRLCDGRVVMTHEGGYSASFVPYCGLAVLECLSGVRSQITDPFLPIMTDYGQQDLQPHQQAAIARAEALLANIR